jgi:hypothetical protein
MINDNEGIWAGAKHIAGAVIYTHMSRVLRPAGRDNQLPMMMSDD